jgi:hypothetical protein
VRKKLTDVSEVLASSTIMATSKLLVASFLLDPEDRKITPPPPALFFKNNKQYSLSLTILT